MIEENTMKGLLSGQDVDRIPQVDSGKSHNRLKFDTKISNYDANLKIQKVEENKEIKTNYSNQTEKYNKFKINGQQFSGVVKANVKRTILPENSNFSSLKERISIQNRESKLSISPKYKQDASQMNYSSHSKNLIRK